jgi:hypothetical protein
VTPAQAAEQQLIATMRDNPGLSVIALAHLTGFNRSTAGERLRQLARRGIVEKDTTGRWRLTEEAEERAEDDVPVTMAAPKPDPGAQSRWVKPLSTYERRETTVVEGLRYG